MTIVSDIPQTWPDAIVDIGLIELSSGHCGVVGLIPYDGHVVFAVIRTPRRPRGPAHDYVPAKPESPSHRDRSSWPSSSGSTKSLAGNLTHRHDTRQVITDPQVRYFGAELREHTLVPVAHLSVGAASAVGGAWVVEARVTHSCWLGVGPRRAGSRPVRHRGRMADPYA